ncbi:MAG: GxxExxY protein [Gracilimonas sp.]
MDAKIFAMTENELSKIILDSAIQVHRSLGPGLLESAYQKCLAYELAEQGLHVETERGLPLIYKEVEMEVGYRVDIFVNQKVIIEIKSVDALNDIHLAQVLTYLKLSGSKLGLLINFNTKLLKNGFRRVVNNL